VFVLPGLVLIMQKKFPQYLTAPLQVLWIEFDELGVYFLSLILALMLEGWFYLLLILFPYGYTKIKKKYPRGFLNHILYFIGITKLKGYPQYFEREFIE